MSRPRQIEALLLAQLPAAVVVGDAMHRVAYCNRAAEELYGAAVGAPLPRELALAVRQDQPWSGDVTFLGRRVHCRAVPLHGADGRVAGSVTVSFERAWTNGDAALRELGARIAAARNEAGLTQQELADGIGVTRRSVQGYEGGRVAPYRHLARIAEVVDRPREWFLGEEPGISLSFRGR